MLILRLFYYGMHFTNLCIFLNIALIYEFVGLCIGRITGSGVAPQPNGVWVSGFPQLKQIITDFIYFKTIIHDFRYILNSPAIMFILGLKKVLISGKRKYKGCNRCSQFFC